MAAYCRRDDIEFIYGQRSVARWADLDGEEDHYEMANRIDWACNFATEYVNSRLTRTHYEVPFSAVPSMIVNITAMQAGICLHDGRTMVSGDDKDQVRRFRKDVDRYLKQILRGQLKLLNPTTQEELSVTVQNQGPFRIDVSDTSSDNLVADDGTIIVFGD